MRSKMRSAGERERNRYVERLIDSGCDISLPELTKGGWTKALYSVRDRRGVGVMALATADLSDRQRHALLRFRFAQYLAVGFVDRDVVWRERLEQEPVSDEERDTVNFVAFSSADGRILANLALRSPAEAPPGTTLATRDRPLLPLEEHFGWGALNRLPLLRNLPLDRVRELGRFVKNQRLGSLGELGVRAVAEVGVAAFHTLTGPLCIDVEAIVGEFEDAVARRSLEFFQVPFTMVRGGLPAFESGHFLRPALDGRARYPFAVLVSDLAPMRARLAAVERALSEPDTRTLVELALDGRGSPARSSLAPSGNVAELASTALPQAELSLGARRRARALGDQLRSFQAFAALSDTELTTLRCLLEEVLAAPGEKIIGRGEPSDAMYLIGAGETDIHRGGPLPARTLGPGDCFGEIGLLTGAARSADVIARSAVQLLRLSRETYRRYVHGLPDVDRQLLRLALMRAASQLGTGS